MVLYESKDICKKITEELKKEFALLTEKLKRKPVLSIIQVGDNPSSSKYIQYKLKKAAELNVEAKHYHFDETISQKDLLKEIDQINESSEGVIVQLPLPKKLPQRVILDAVRFTKDVDGLSSRNEFNFYNDKDEFSYFVPATALAVKELIEHYNIEVKDAKVAVIGRSLLVGKPIAHLIKQMGANVSTYNKKSTIKGVENADIVITGAGAPLMLKKENLKENSIIIDVGATYIEKNGKKILVGDLDTTDIDGYVKGISPVPGGVGPLTVVSLFSNLAKAVRNKLEI